MQSQTELMATRYVIRIIGAHDNMFSDCVGKFIGRGEKHGAHYVRMSFTPCVHQAQRYLSRESATAFYTTKVLPDAEDDCEYMPIAEMFSIAIEPIEVPLFPIGCA